MKTEDKKRKKKISKGIFYVIMPHLADLINGKKNTVDEWKTQINVGLNFISSNDTGEIRTFFVRSDNEEIRSGNETFDIINKLIESFLNNYEKEEKILRNGSSFVFESADSLAYYIL